MANNSTKSTKSVKTTKSTKTTKSIVNTKVLCPKCGAEFKIPEKETVGVATMIGKNSGLGIVTPELANESNAPANKNAAARLQALKEAGVDVSNLFAVQGADGAGYIASNKDGKLVVLNDNDPIFSYITENGDIPNRKLFRRWVMSQMFRILSMESKYGKDFGYTESVHRKGYDYQWKMTINELNAQVAMEKHGDIENLKMRKLWFNAKTVLLMARDYIDKLEKFINTRKRKSCKGVPYITLGGKNIFVSDIKAKVIYPLTQKLWGIESAKTASQLLEATVKFNNCRVKGFRPAQSQVWLDSYKGSGAYYTLENMVRFHGCVIFDDNNNKLDKNVSLWYLKEKAVNYEGEGWRVLGLLRKVLKDNNVNIDKKMSEWRKK